MAKFQVVSIGETTGRRFAVREAHDSFARAQWHLELCRRAWPGVLYAIDVTYRGADGQTHWRGGVTAEDLGYTLEEMSSGEQVSLLPLPDSLIPVVRCKDVAALLGDPLAEITPAAMETLRLRGQVKMTDPDSLR